MVHRDMDLCQPQPYKRSWQELQKAVKGSRNLGAMLSVRIPTSFTFSRFIAQDGRSKCRVHFLGMPATGSRMNTITFVDLDLSAGNSLLEWKFLLEDMHLSSTHKLSKEEELLRERKRLSLRGITTFETDGKGHFIFPAANMLYSCEDKFANEQVVM